MRSRPRDRGTPQEPRSSTRFHFYLLGDLETVWDGQHIPSPPLRTQGLLGILLLRPNPRRRERLAGLLFPTVTERRGRHRLSHTLWELRQWLPALPIETTAETLHLPMEHVWLDVDAFQQAATQDDLATWQSALALYRGDLLEGLYDDWLLEEREALYLEYIRLAHRVCETLWQRGDLMKLLPLAEKLSQREPFDERALRRLMNVYRSVGRRGAALAAYDRFAALAATELGVAPEPATQALAQAIQLSAVPPCTSRGIVDGSSPETLLDQARVALARAVRGLRSTLSHTNVLDEALAMGEEELRIWRDLGLASEEAAALEGLATIQNHLGRSADSLRTMTRAGEISKQLGDPMRMAINRYNLAYSLLYHDVALAPRALEEARAALATFQAHLQPGWEAATLIALGYTLWVDGQYGAALDHFQRAYALSERIGELAYLPELLAYQGLAHLGLGQRAEGLNLTGRAMLAMAQGEVSEEVIPEIIYAHAMALAANGQEAEANRTLSQAYERLLAGAASLENEEARQAFFHRNPTMRRLMGELRARGIAPPLGAGVRRTRLPAARGGSVLVHWTVDAGPADAALERSRGSIALRRVRVGRLMREAQDQGALPSTADLAATLEVSSRTIQRDLAALRQRETPLQP